MMTANSISKLAWTATACTFVLLCATFLLRDKPRVTPPIVFIPTATPTPTPDACELEKLDNQSLNDRLATCSAQRVRLFYALQVCKGFNGGFDTALADAHRLLVDCENRQRATHEATQTREAAQGKLLTAAQAESATAQAEVATLRGELATARDKVAQYEYEATRFRDSLQRLTTAKTQADLAANQSQKELADVKAEATRFSDCVKVERKRWQRTVGIVPGFGWARAAKESKCRLGF